MAAVQSATLMHLSNELLLEIFEHLQPITDEDNNTQVESPAVSPFVALALTCRHFHPFAVKFLYSTIQVKPRLAGLTPLLKTITERKEYALLINNISVSARHSELSSKVAYSSDDGCRLFDAVERYAQILELSNRPKRNNSTVPFEVELGVLILLSKNLESLDLINYKSWTLGGNAHTKFTHLIALLSPWSPHIGTTNPPNRFDKLCELRLYIDHLHDERFAFLFDLPSLKSLDLYVGKNLIVPRNWPLRARSSSVENLGFRSPKITSRLVSLCVLSCKRLREFRVETKRITEEEPQPFPSLIEALESHKDSLKSLFIAMEMQEFLGEYLTLEKLRHLHELEALTLSISLLHRPPIITDPSGLGYHDGITHPDWTGYPDISVLLPPNLGRLHLTLDQCMLEDTQYDDVLLTLISPDASTPQTLTWVSVTYTFSPNSRAAQVTGFPLDFINLTQKFSSYEVRFTYTIDFTEGEMTFLVGSIHHARANTSSDCHLPMLVDICASMGMRGWDVASHVTIHEGTDPVDFLDKVKTEIEYHEALTNDPRFWIDQEDNWEYQDFDQEEEHDSWAESEEEVDTD